MNRAPSGRSRTTAIGAITVSAPRSRSEPETYNGFTPLSSAARSRSAPPAARCANGWAIVSSAPSGSRTCATTDWVAAWNPAASSVASGTTITFAPAVRGPSGGGAAAERTLRASATPSTRVGALSSSPHSKRWAESAAGRRPSLQPPARAAAPARGDQLPGTDVRDRDRPLERRRGEVGERPGRGVVRVAERAAERQHAVRGRVVDERVDVDETPDVPDARAEPDEPPAADLGLGRAARTADEQRRRRPRAEGVGAQHGLAHELRDAHRVERGVAGRVALDEVGELGADVRGPRQPVLARGPLGAAQGLRDRGAAAGEARLGEEKQGGVDVAEGRGRGGGRRRRSGG